MNDYGPHIGLGALNPVTNLRAAYRNAHPDVPTVAWAKVAATLGVPVGLDPATGFRMVGTEARRCTRR